MIRVCRLCPLGGGSAGGEDGYYHSHHTFTLYLDCGKCKEHWTIKTITIRSVGIIQPIRYNKFSITNYISCVVSSGVKLDCRFGELGRSGGKNK